MTTTQNLNLDNSSLESGGVQLSCISTGPSPTSTTEHDGFQYAGQPGNSSCASDTLDIEMGLGSVSAAPLRLLSPLACLGRSIGPRTPVTLSWPGCGILMFWQLGVMKGLAEHYDLTKTPMIASSSGAVAVAFAACGVDMKTAVDRGVALSHEFGVENRRFGLVGIWGQLVRQWLEDLLPEDAHIRARHTTLLVTTLPRLRTRRYSKFHSKQDLIQVIMASAHIPLILDWQWYVQCREHAACIDGGFWWWFCRSEREYLYSCDTTHGDIDPCVGPLPGCTAADLAAAAAAATPELPPSGSSTSSSISGTSHNSGNRINDGGGTHTHCGGNGEPIMLLRPYDDESFMANIAEYDRIKPKNSLVAHEMMVYGEAFAKQMMQRWVLAGISEVGRGGGGSEC